MKSSFAIAYANQDGKDFNGLPWILDDLNNEEECMTKVSEMIADGFQNVIPFQFEQRRKKDEEFDWKYVKEHSITIIDKECICCKRYYSNSCDGAVDRGRPLLTSSNMCSGFLMVCNENDCDFDEKLFCKIKSLEKEIGIS